MIDDAERVKRLAVVRRIAVGMAERNNDPILAKTKILSESTFQGSPKSGEELDAKNPVATQSDGGRYFSHVRMDGRGQLNIIWPSGNEKTFKFLIPEEYLSNEGQELAAKPLPKAPTQQAGVPASEMDQAIIRIRNVDPQFPTSISQIPTFPFTSFGEMQKAIAAGKFAIAKFSFHHDPTILGLVSPGRSLFYTVSMLASYLVPIVSIVLAFAVSHWFWLGLLYFFIGARLTGSIWKTSILKAAYSSESAFCLLFYTSKINAYDLTNAAEYEWQQITEKG